MQDRVSRVNGNGDRPAAQGEALDPAQELSLRLYAAELAEAEAVEGAAAAYMLVAAKTQDLARAKRDAAVAKRRYYFERHGVDGSASYSDRPDGSVARDAPA